MSLPTRWLCNQLVRVTANQVFHGFISQRAEMKNINWSRLLDQPSLIWYQEVSWESEDGQITSLSKCQLVYKNVGASTSCLRTWKWSFEVCFTSLISIESYNPRYSCGKYFINKVLKTICYTFLCCSMMDYCVLRHITVTST